jgi:6-pyruvoyltetrahydropterin/6-carboxytetrahydropterin synthase
MESSVTPERAGRFRIGITRTFSAAHLLRGYKGKCEALHGHNWKVEIQVCANRLDTQGMVLDFGVLKQHTDDLLGELDHTLINDHPYFQQHNPSSEELARYLYRELEKRLDPPVVVARVRVWESENSWAVFEV